MISFPPSIWSCHLAISFLSIPARQSWRMSTRQMVLFSGLAGRNLGQALNPSLEIALREFAVGGAKAVHFSIAQHLGDAIIGFVYIMAIQTRKSRNLPQELSRALALHIEIIGGDNRMMQAGFVTRQITRNILKNNTLGL